MVSSVFVFFDLRYQQVQVASPWVFGSFFFTAHYFSKTVVDFPCFFNVYFVSRGAQYSVALYKRAMAEAIRKYLSSPLQLVHKKIFTCHHLILTKLSKTICLILLL